MGLLSEKNKEVLLGPLSANNPVVVQMLGICSALAVTSKLEPAIDGYLGDGCRSFR